MANNALGRIRSRGTDSDGNVIWNVEVQVGTRSNRQTMSGTVHGSRRDAELLASKLRMQLCARPIVNKTITVDEYFEMVYIPQLEEERGLTKETIRGYRNTYAKWISPKHGGRRISTLTDDDVRTLIAESGAQRNVKRTYQALLNTAYRDHLLRRRIDLTGMKLSKQVRKQTARWTPAELIDAIEKLRGEEIVEPYLLLGTSGLRKEEIRAITPKDVLVLDDGEGKTRVALTVDAAYTDLDGLKPPKNDGSERTGIVISAASDRLLEVIEDLSPRLEAAAEGVWIIRYVVGWTRRRGVIYDDRLFRGTKGELEQECQRIRSDGGLPSKLSIKLVEAGEDAWVMRVPRGYDDGLERKYEEEAFLGTEEAAREHAAERWSHMRLLPCTDAQLRGRWDAALERHGLRRVPPNSLRHASEDLMSISNVSPAAIQKAHGHSSFSMDYHYMAQTPEMLLEISRRVDDHLSGAAGTTASLSAINLKRMIGNAV